MRDHRDFPGRLVADDEGAHTDDTAELVAYSYEDEGGYSAEEVAVQFIPEEEEYEEHEASREDDEYAEVDVDW